MSDYFRGYDLRSTSATETTDDIAIILNHIRLGTAQIQFYNSKDKAVDQVHILEPFFLRVSVWKGRYNKDGSLKYQFDRSISRQLFKFLLDRVDITLHDFTKELKFGEEIAKIKGKQKEFEFFLEDYDAYVNGNNGWKRYYEKNGYSWDVDHVNSFRKDYPYFKQFTNKEIQQPGFILFKTGMAMRYKAKFNEELDFNPYILHYMIMEITEDGYLTKDSARKLFERYSSLIYEKPIKWSPRTRAHFFLKLANSWTHIANVVEKDGLKQDKLIREIFGFNPKAPTFLFMDYFTNRENMISYLWEVCDSSHKIFPEILKMWGDDEEICNIFMNKVNAPMASFSKHLVYRYFSERVKLLPSILSQIDNSCVKYLPKEFLSNKEFMMGIFKKLDTSFSSGLSSSLLRHIPRDLREDVDILQFFLSDYSHYQGDSDFDGQMDRFSMSLFSKEFVDRYVQCGSKCEKKGELVVGREIFVGSNDCELFQDYTNKIACGLKKISEPFTFQFGSEFSITWKKVPKKIDKEFDVDDFRKLLKRRRIEIRHNNSAFYISMQVIKNLEIKKNADRLTLELEASKAIKGATRSGRSKI